MLVVREREREGETTVYQCVQTSVVTKLRPFWNRLPVLQGAVTVEILAGPIWAS